MQKYFFTLCFFIILWPFQLDFAFADAHKFTQVQIASSPNPVGSGARALGMGGAFIAVADDATAASWNPGGLIQLKKPEISVVGNWFHRVEDNAFGNNPEASGSQSVSEQDLNYLSMAYPFTLFNRNMIVSLNYQHLYDFTREWDLSFAFTIKHELGAISTRKEKVDYQQKGSLSALGLAYCIQITPQLSFGFTLNLWDDDITRSRWQEKTHFKASATLEVPLPPPMPPLKDTYEFQCDCIQKYSFSGFNTNIGILWRATDKLTVGLVFKSPFTADLKHETTTEIIKNNGPKISTKTSQDEKLDMPMSYGAGLSYRFSDKFTIAADIYRTEWQHFVLTDSDGYEKCPMTGKSVHESDIDPTYQVRLGAEYLFINPKSRYVIPIRGGLFYDPAPADGSPDDYYGFSLGSGIGIGRYVFDVAFQYRFGNDVGASMVQNYDNFSQDVDEYMVYSSLIIHF